MPSRRSSHALEGIYSTLPEKNPSKILSYGLIQPRDPALRCAGRKKRVAPSILRWIVRLQQQHDIDRPTGGRLGRWLGRWSATLHTARRRSPLPLAALFCFFGHFTDDDCDDVGRLSVTSAALSVAAVSSGLHSAHAVSGAAYRKLSRRPPPPTDIVAGAARNMVASALRPNSIVLIITRYAAVTAEIVSHLRRRRGATCSRLQNLLEEIFQRKKQIGVHTVVVSAA